MIALIDELVTATKKAVDGPLAIDRERRHEKTEGHTFVAYDRLCGSKLFGEPNLVL